MEEAVGNSNLPGAGPEEPAMKILQISEVNDDIGTVYFSAIFYFEWKDTRITNKNASESSGYRFTLRNWQDQVWYPYIYIKDLKDFEVYQIARQPSVGKKLDDIVAGGNFLEQLKPYRLKNFCQQAYLWTQT